MANQYFPKFHLSRAQISSKIAAPSKWVSPKEGLEVQVIARAFICQIRQQIVLSVLDVHKYLGTRAVNMRDWVTSM